MQKLIYILSDFVQIIASSFISKSQMGVRDFNICIIITSNFNISVFGYNKWKNLMMLNIKVSSPFTLSQCLIVKFHITYKAREVTN